GCLFDRRLCSPQEVCVQDGLFGQCQVGSVQDRPYFQVTSPVLQRLQDVLRHLMAKGLSWQDGLTQYVISQEMERIPRLRPPPPLEPAARDRAGWGAAPSPGGSHRCRLPPRFLPLRGSPRRALHTTDAGLPAAQHLGQPPPLLPSALLQRYLEHLLLPPPPQLAYEEALLQPYSYHNFGYQDGAHQLPSSSTRQSPDTAALLGRVPAQALFGAGPVPSYGGQPGTDGGHLFQDLGMLSLPREKASRLDPAPARLQHSLRLPDDFRDVEREQPAALAAQPARAQPDAALKRLASVLASYGLALPELSAQQLSSLSALLQLLQGPGERDTRDRAGSPRAPSAPCPSLQVTEGDMQHREEPEPLSSTAPAPTMPTSSSSAKGLRDRAGHVAAPQEQPQRGHSGDVLSTGKLVTVEKKSYAEAKDAGEPRGVRPPDEYGYIVTDQKPLGLEAGVRLLQVLAKRVHLSTASFINISVVGPALTFRIRQNPQNLSLADVASRAERVKAELEAELGLKIVQTGVGQRNEAAAYPHPSRFGNSFHAVLLTFIALACVAGIAIAAAAAFCLRHHAKQREKERLAALGPEGAADSTFEYQEWQALCAYQAEPNACAVAHSEANLKKNRNPDYVPYDHVRIKLKAESNPSRSDFINASPIIEHDPRMPAYIATQGPLSHTIADFWQMVWEHGCTVIVMLSPLAEDSVKQCDRYWPDEGSSLYHIYEASAGARPAAQGRGWRSLTPPGLSRAGEPGVKEIDIAATLEHIRDQRPGMVQTKVTPCRVPPRRLPSASAAAVSPPQDQFEFALTAVAEEVNAILKALPQ
ncbi:PTPRN protein, partial [Nothocercus julius]|nr:PTPRN protein [Nothocercus julius]